MGPTPFGDAVAPGATVTTEVFDVDAGRGRLTLRFVPAYRANRIDERTCNVPSPVKMVSGA